MSGQTGPVGGHRTGEARQDEVRAIIEKYERESNIRLWTGRSRQLVRLGLALFILLTFGPLRRAFCLGDAAGKSAISDGDGKQQA